MEYKYDNKNIDEILNVTDYSSVKTYIKQYDENDVDIVKLKYWQEDSPEYVKNIKDDILYTLNKQYFRSDSFEKFNNENINILYAGCSFTFGMGIPDDFLWTNLLTNKIQETTDKKVDPYNIGFRGFSNYLIIKNIMSFIRNYGKPDYIFALFPDCARDFIFNDFDNNYGYVFPRFFNAKGSSKFEVNYTKNFTYETNIMRSSDMIKHLEDFCYFANIKLYWTSWYYPDYKIYKNNNFLSLVETDTSFLQANAGYQRMYTDIEHGVQYPYMNTNNLPYWDLARDLVHPGTAWTHHISSEFFREYVK
jgi:hypothetical protein